ncbi:ATP-binding cassette domain-containing protein [Lignipirellula cremea]|uniref:Multidrug export ATP-binding/permease protein n=1 Tax=Lignipirellula cremea TaxID=2528010 RepID=A0A518DZM0_9BACT|nr:ABC transporter ATP-binding protein [Lignipirellula cremea]QDU97282.1 Putative multidrug export ATP-binding/permease protein [Lignipirellula cremea]
MSKPSFRRILQMGRPASVAPIYLFGILLALVTPLLILDLGLIVQTVAGLHPPGVEPTDLVIQPIITSDSWPPGKNRAFSMLILVGAGLTLAVLESALLMLQSRAIQKAALDISTRLQLQIHKQAFIMGGNEPLGLTRSRPEELFTDKVEQIREGLAHWWRAIPRSAATLATLTLLACMVDWQKTLAGMLLMVGLWRCYVWRRKQIEESARRWSERTQSRRDLLLEDLRMAPLAATYSIDQIPGESFDDKLKQYKTAALKLGYTRNAMAPFMVLIGLLAGGFLLFMVGVASNTTVWGAAILGVSLVCGWFPAQRLFRLWKVRESVEPACEQVLAYLDREPDVVQMASAQTLDRVRKTVELDRVTLANHAGRKLLDQVSLSIPASGNIGFLASDSQTPMALAGLFVRYYDPTAGRLLYDSHDIRNVTIDSLRSQAALVACDGLLFTGAIGDNIRCGDETYSTTHVTEASRLAAVEDFISRLPQGYSTVVGEQGRSLSKSEAFRVALARAIIRQPSVLIIEEPDTATDGEAIDAALRNVKTDRTLILLPSRLVTLRMLDEIVFFHEGRIHGQGKHADLLKSNDLYRHLIYVRFNEHKGKI